MLGVKRHEVQLLAHDAAWAADFEQVKAALQGIFGAELLQIEHVGSTAVADLMAKPLLDVAAVLQRVQPEKIAQLEKIGYEFEGFQADLQRYFLVKREAGQVSTQHVSLYLPGSQNFAELVRFRDILRENAAVRRAYQALKLDLAEKFPKNRPAYTQAKTGFIRKTLEEN